MAKWIMTIKNLFGYFKKASSEVVIRILKNMELQNI